MSGRELAEPARAACAPHAAARDHPAARDQRDVAAALRRAGLRPTRQRMALSRILFAQDWHVTAEILHNEAARANVRVSLATVYNTLHRFTGIGLLRQVAADGSKTYFDTNTSEHHHFFVEAEGALVDIPIRDVAVDRLPPVPAGYEAMRIEVLVRLRRRRG